MTPLRSLVLTHLLRSLPLRVTASAGLLLAGGLLVGCERKPCSKDCSFSGRCTPTKGERCVATSQADCGRSKICRYYGKCTLHEGACARRSAADCKRSNKCLWAGECGFVDGKCTAVKATDCKVSKYCADKGFCRLKRKYGGRAICTK